MRFIDFLEPNLSTLKNIYFKRHTSECDKLNFQLSLLHANYLKKMCDI